MSKQQTPPFQDHLWQKIAPFQDQLAKIPSFQDHWAEKYPFQDHYSKTCQSGEEKMATQNDFIQWTKYHTNALSYLDALNLEECPFHTKVKMFIEADKCHFTSPTKGRKFRKKHKKKVHARPGSRQSCDRAHNYSSKWESISNSRQSCLPKATSCKDRNNCATQKWKLWTKLCHQPSHSP